MPAAFPRVLAVMPRRQRGWCLAVVAAATVSMLTVAGCAGRPSATRMSLDRPVSSSLSIGTDTRRLLAPVASVILNDLELPLSFPLSVYFYPSQEALELGLVTDGRVERWMAREQARFASGVGTRYGVFLREDKLSAAPLLTRVGVIAHELAHVAQYELAGGHRGSSDQWLREGMAEWASFRVLEHFALRSYAESKRRALQEARGIGSVRAFPSLSRLVTNREWTAVRNESGRGVTYGQAFLAFDRLLERAGLDPVLDYFRRSGRVNDRARNFEAAFGLPFAEFQDEFQAWLSRLFSSGGSRERSP